MSILTNKEWIHTDIWQNDTVGRYTRDAQNQPCQKGTENCTQIPEYCESINCLEYITPDYTHTLKWILWGNWTVSFLVTLIGIIYMYRIWVQHKMLLDQWPYNQIVYKIPLQKFKGIIPVTLIKFGLFCKIVPSLVIDVMDIFFDTMYFNEMVTNKVLDPSIHISTHVYIIIFTFQITGTIKNIILVTMANRQINSKELTKTKKTKTGSIIRNRGMDESESTLADRNAYMYINFCQTILAFLMQDGPEASIQYFYVDKYLAGMNYVVLVSSSMRFMMSCRMCYIFFRYVRDFIDPDFHDFRTRVLLWSMVGVKFIISSAHALRSTAILLIANHEGYSRNRIFCVNIQNENEIHQDPWNFSCLTGLDETLAILCCVSVIGVFSGIYVVLSQGEKLYQQSHYTGRTGMVSVGHGYTKASKFEKFRPNMSQIKSNTSFLTNTVTTISDMAFAGSTPEARTGPMTIDMSDRPTHKMSLFGRIMRKKTTSRTEPVTVSPPRTPVVEQ